MQVELSQTPLGDLTVDILAMLLFEDEELPAELAGARGAGDVRAGYRKTTLIHPDRPERATVIGVGSREEFDLERARVAGALAVRAAAAVRAVTLALVPGDERPGVAGAMVEGAILASYRFDRFHTTGDEETEDGSESEGSEEGGAGPEQITVLASAAAAGEVEVARVVALAANRAREHQNLPSNVATPSYLAERATEIATQFASVTCEVIEREEMVKRGMGGLVAVSAGTVEPPKLIVLRYTGGGTGTLGLIGKAVTFDSGGISIKPSSGMHEMKMDMSGGAAVIEALAAVAELALELNVLAVIPSTENLPSGTAVKPGDIITQLNGKTVEVNNTDAEGRLILADALAFAVAEGADPLIDLATLTGAVLIALGSTYAALISNDDELAEEVRAASERTGEIAWRLPLHPEYKELTKGTVADLTNASEKRKAGTIYAASFLEEFVDETPWAHLDIAGTAWDFGRAYASKGPTGYGVRLLVDFARARSDGT